MTTNLHHAINYIEFRAAGKIAEMKAFYGTVFGWQFQDWGETYVSFASAEAGIEGGFDGETASPGSDAVRHAPLVILYSENLEASQAAVRDAGGKIIEDTYSFPGGRRFHFTDPAGNELAIWTEQETA